MDELPPSAALWATLRAIDDERDRNSGQDRRAILEALERADRAILDGRR